MAKKRRREPLTAKRKETLRSKAKPKPKEKPKPKAKLPAKCPQGCGPHPPHDASVFVNPDGTVAWTTTTSNCPRVIKVTANKHQKVAGDAQCNPNFNYQPLIDDASQRIDRFIAGYNCPGGCPFKEFFPTPGVALHTETSCSQLAAGRGVIYTAHLRGYFVCTDVQE